MMKCLKMVFIFCLMCYSLGVPFVFSQESTSTDYLADLQDLRDPFAPQLPLPKDEPPPVTKPVPVVPMQPAGQTGLAAQPKPVGPNPALAVQPNAAIEVESLVVK